MDFDIKKFKTVQNELEYLYEYGLSAIRSANVKKIKLVNRGILKSFLSVSRRISVICVHIYIRSVKAWIPCKVFFSF